MSSSRFLFSVPALIAGLFPVSVFAQAAALRQGVTSAASTAGLSGACSGTSCVTTIIGNVISIAVGFLGVLLLLYILYAGFLWTTSGGDAGQVDKAKSYIKNAIIGLVIVSLAFVISSFVLDQVARITNPASSVTPGAPPPPAGGPPPPSIRTSAP
ncbi:hypothetical protein KBD13_01095 [Patescibacteria group bacterium]|nr:hypothetical protein [Patescibacteria group bacterium]